MLKRFLTLPIIITLAVTLLLLFILIHSRAHETLPDTKASGGYNPLSVSQDGSQTTTNFSGADLQQAAPPTTGTAGPEPGSSQVSP